MKKFLTKKLQQLDSFASNEGFVDILTYSFIFVYVFAAIIVSLNRYWQFQSFYFDFGIVDRAIWLYSKFRLPLVDHIRFFGDNEGLILGDHFGPSLALLSPLYWFTNKREILLIAQAIIVGTAAVIAYNFSKKVVTNKLVSFSLIVALLGYVGMQNALITEFHDSTLAVLPLVVLFWAAFQKKWKVYFSVLILLLGLKELNATLGVGVGLFLLLKDRKLPKYGLLTIGICVAWYVATVFVVIPAISGTPYNYLPTGARLGSIASLVSPAVKVQTVFYSLLSFLFFPLGSLAVLPAVLMNFFERFMSTESSRWTLGMHYNATLSVLMFMASVFVFERIEKVTKSKVVTNTLSIFIVLTVVVLHRFVLHGPLGLFYNKVFYEQNKRVVYVEEFISNVPEVGSIMTTNDLALRFTHRTEGVFLPRAKYQAIAPDLVVLNLTPGQNPNSFYPLSYEDTVNIKNNLLLDPGYSYKTFNDNQYIFYKQGDDL